MDIDDCQSTNGGGGTTATTTTTPTTSAASSSSCSATTRELFVVQRCWHSGPHQYQPLDLMRLFLTQRDAEEAAYHSAHAWCRYHRPDAEPQVKTLLLPSYPSHNTSGSSYGFIAHGSLFWVRSLYATTSATTEGIAAAASSSSSAAALAAAACEFPATEGYAVVTEGVIGGTGNRMSRRGTEVPVGRVFVPLSGGTRTMMMMVPVNNYAANEVMRHKAFETCHYVLAQLGGGGSNNNNNNNNNIISTHVATLPIGRPTEYTSGNFLKDWPPQVLQPHLLQSPYNQQDPHKRGAPEFAAAVAAAAIPPERIPFVGHSMRTVSTTYEDQQDVVTDEEGIVVDCPFEMPVAKRRRFCDDRDGGINSLSLSSSSLSVFAPPPLSSSSTAVPTSIPFTQEDVMMG